MSHCGKVLAGLEWQQLGLCWTFDHSRPLSDFYMAKKTLKVDRKKFEGIVKNLLQSKPVKRENVKVSKKKPEKLIPPQK